MSKIVEACRIPSKDFLNILPKNIDFNNKKCYDEYIVSKANKIDKLKGKVKLMKFKRFKKTMAVFLAFVFMVSAAKTPAGAHIEVNWRGNITGHNTQSLKFFVFSSARNTILTMSGVYEPARQSAPTGWNNIFQRVNISSITSTSPASDSILVQGMNLGNTTFGRIAAYDRNGNMVGGNWPNDTTVHQNWHVVTIWMNNTDNIWKRDNSNLSTATQRQRAKGVFLHEIGHALKLQHPAVGDEISQPNGHSIPDPMSGGFRWYANSVMNSGDYPGKKSWIAFETKTHDRQNLTDRWW